MHSRGFMVGHFLHGHFLWSNSIILWSISSILVHSRGSISRSLTVFIRAFCLSIKMTLISLQICGLNGINDLEIIFKYSCWYICPVIVQHIYLFCCYNFHNELCFSFNAIKLLILDDRIHRKLWYPEINEQIQSLRLNI
ncbi:hypothetical protein RchiOBHm_Chr5g0078671 [Rosa chinensis]|uniref:Uncharacterized protein n=1 Tax=Rosa chinensis TaxID=74649 RepID=A0A2P6QMC1_ROSCH|nr:hypothetical protein RchiOBHm_Chr5g0078671 [Rosa chinensis]